MATPLDLKLRLADAIRDTERAEGILAVRLNNLKIARVDVTHARITLANRREDERDIRRQLRELEQVDKRARARTLGDVGRRRR